MRPKVSILLSTYNGERFLIEQLESILEQTERSFRIEVRDDGSTDGTIAILETYRNKYPDIFSTNYSSNCGVKSSFLKLLKDSGESEYYAFSDQDDIWKKDKLEVAIKALEKNGNAPALYTCKQEFIDENGLLIGESPADFQLSFAGALVESLTWGCTLVFNKAARDLVVQRDFAFDNIISHDWWIYLVVSAQGQIISDPTPRIGYRQHSNNDNGFQTKLIPKLLFRIKRFKRSGITRWSKQALEFYRLYQNDISDNEKKKTLQLIERSKQNIGDRITLILSRRISRHSLLDSIIIRLIALFGAY